VFRAGAVRVSVDFTEAGSRTRTTRAPVDGQDMLDEFIELNNRVLDRFSAAERVNIGRTRARAATATACTPGGAVRAAAVEDVQHQRRVLPDPVLERGGPRDVYRMCGKYSREDANGVPQVCFMGVINPLDPRVETAEEVRDQLVLAAKHIPVERLGATDDCGFSPFSRDVKPSTARRTSRATSRCRRSRRGSRARSWRARRSASARP